MPTFPLDNGIRCCLLSAKLECIVISKNKFLALSFILLGWLGAAHAQNDKPNILVIWGDDIGIFNISAYSHGLMGYETPNIDQVAAQGAIFSDFYAEQSCTAGAPRSSPGRSRFAPACSRWGCPAPSRASATRTPPWRSC